ncbi:MAG: exo-beta-N-acetylmuramidase NamZ family protein, partial [Bacteroidia bacterium]
MGFSRKNTKIIGLTGLLLLLFISSRSQRNLVVKDFSSVICGDSQFDKYLPLLKNKRVAVITNITGVIGTTSIVDTLLKLKVDIKKIFGPEHGFRSDIDAGEKVSSNIDQQTGLPIVSLYGSNKKPSKEQLSDVDVVIYDIQDIGVRFYTYISTMCYAMEACAENKKEFIVLDRPNPNGFYIDGPVMKNEFKSFLGLHNVPLVYGMTCGEYAQMVNGEGWLKNKVKCALTVITLKNYDRIFSYNLPVRPSPNIPNETSVLLYPSLGLFEGTIVSLGRGTDMPFQVIGYPGYKDTSFCFTPKETPVNKNPKYKNERCCGLDLRKDNYIIEHPRFINLGWIREMLKGRNKADFFDKNFNYHAGNSELQVQLQTAMPI